MTVEEIRRFAERALEGRAHSTRYDSYSRPPTPEEELSALTVLALCALTEAVTTNTAALGDER